MVGIVHGVAKSQTRVHFHFHFKEVNKSPMHLSIQYLSKAYSAKPCSVNLLRTVSNPTSPTAFIFFDIPSLNLSVGMGDRQ